VTYLIGACPKCVLERRVAMDVLTIQGDDSASCQYHGTKTNEEWLSLMKLSMKYKRGKGKKLC
jgi:hypothetical protein